MMILAVATAVALLAACFMAVAFMVLDAWDMLHREGRWRHR